MKKFKSVSFQVDGKKYVLPVREKNVFDEPVVRIQLSDNTAVTVTQQQREGQCPVYAIRHFWPMEKTSVLGRTGADSVFWDSAKSQFVLSRKLTRLFREMAKKGVYPRFF